MWPLVGVRRCGPRAPHMTRPASPLTHGQPDRVNAGLSPIHLPGVAACTRAGTPVRYRPGRRVFDMVGRRGGPGAARAAGSGAGTSAFPGRGRQLPRPWSRPRSLVPSPSRACRTSDRWLIRTVRHEVRRTGTTRAVATAASPSARPVKPRPSLVVPEIATGAPMASERTFWASSRRLPTLGRTPIT